MRRSAAGMGGGGGGGGANMLRAVGRAVCSGVAGLKGAASATETAAGRTPKLARVSSLSSRSSSAAVMAAASRGSALCFCDGEEWEAVEGRDEEEEEGRIERVVFGAVPSEEEAEEAVSAIRQMFIPVPFGEIIEKSPHDEQVEVKDKAVISTKILPRSLSTESQSDWIEPVMHLYSSRSCRSEEREKVLDAFRLLQINPAIQRVVVSLSSDKAVWDAVMKNEVVQEFKKSFYEAEIKPQEPDEGDAHAANGILKWIVDTKAKIMEVLDKIAKHLSQLFHSHGAKDERDIFDNVLQSSFMLSVLVFIVVVINRVQKS